MSSSEFPTPEERRQHVLKLREQGLSFTAIGRDLKVTRSRAREIFIAAEKAIEHDEQLSVDELTPVSPAHRFPISRRARDVLTSAKFATLNEIISMDREDFIQRFLIRPGGNRRTLNEILDLLGQFETRPSVQDSK